MVEDEAHFLYIILVCTKAGSSFLKAKHIGAVQAGVRVGYWSE